jgi:hypothetical protein
MRPPVTRLCVPPIARVNTCFLFSHAVLRTLWVRARYSIYLFVRRARALIHASQNPHSTLHAPYDCAIELSIYSAKQRVQASSPRVQQDTVVRIQHQERVSRPALCAIRSCSRPSVALAAPKRTRCALLQSVACEGLERSTTTASATPRMTIDLLNPSVAGLPIDPTRLAQLTMIPVR